MVSYILRRRTLVKRKDVEMQMQLRMKECEIQQCRLSKEKDERVPLALSSLRT
jgi:hypothetical protein